MSHEESFCLDPCFGRLLLLLDAVGFLVAAAVDDLKSGCVTLAPAHEEADKLAIAHEELESVDSVSDAGSLSDIHSTEEDDVDVERDGPPRLGTLTLAKDETDDAVT